MWTPGQREKLSYDAWSFPWKVCAQTQACAEDGRVSADCRGNCWSSHCSGAVRLHVAADAQLRARRSCQRTSAWTRSSEGVTGFCSVSRESGHIFI